MFLAQFSEILKQKYLYNELYDTSDRFSVYDCLMHTGSKLISYFSSHDNICVSVSGGSDSDCIIHIICNYFPEFLDKCHFVFVNTGLEYDATKRHIKDLESIYGIEIIELRGKSVVWVCKNFGFPILNKVKAHYIDMFQRRTPKGYYLVFEANDSHMHFKFTENERNLARYLDANGIRVSSKCCDLSKKQPIFDFYKDHHIDLSVDGERKAEGGVRSVTHKSCFEVGNHGIDKFMPLWWWSDRVKFIFKSVEGFTYSDCYEVYGLKRTGCCGCPFGKNVAVELAVMHQFEPQLYKACMSVFGLSYELTDLFNCRRKKCLCDTFQLILAPSSD